MVLLVDAEIVGDSPSQAFSAWRYESRVEDRGGDEDGCRKRFHYALHTDGSRVSIDHSPYEMISDEAFAAHVALGFPSPPVYQSKHGGTASGPWRNASIIAALAKAGGAA